MTDFNEKPIIALLTDFGKRGQHYVASIKAIILRINPYVRFVDISHQISPYSIVEASYVLKSTYKLFPKGTIFIIVVDPGVGSSREILAIKTKSNYFFVGPNNGIFSSAISLDCRPTLRFGLNLTKSFSVDNQKKRHYFSVLSC